MPTTRPKLLIFASGTASGGGSGFRTLAHKVRFGSLKADIVGAVSQHPDGGVRHTADEYGVQFFHFKPPFDAASYQRIADETGAECIALSGWIKLVKGLDPRCTFNIHPGPLPDFGGKGMYGLAVHEAVLAAFKKGKLTHTAVCMHFVTDEYDRGPVFFRIHIPIHERDTPTSLQARVHHHEQCYQPWITRLVLAREISWDGSDPTSLTLPAGYRIDHE